MIYVDNAATTAVRPEVLQAMLPYFTQVFANPGEPHAAGRAAHDAVRESRARVADRLGCEPDDVVFTASGSESDNQAMATAVAWGEARGRTHVVTSAFEHPAVLQSLREWERRGVEVTLVAPDAEGLVDPDAVAAAVRPGRTCLVTVMTVNNEVGTVQPVGGIARVAHDAGALFHTDAVQAVGHVSVDMAADDIDMLSVSAHKFHGPKGVGLLAARHDALGGPLAVVPLVRGGGQERGRRAATENVPGIVGLAEALALAVDGLAQSTAYVSDLRDRAMQGLLAIPGAHLMGSREHRNPGTVNVCFEGVHREALLALLDRRGICASAGSACESGAAAPSPVLRAMGVPDELARGALRLSLCEDNTAREIDQVVEAVRECVASLRHAGELASEEGL